MKDRKLSAEMRGFRFFCVTEESSCLRFFREDWIFLEIGLRDKVNPRKNLIFGREEQEKGGAFTEMWTIFEGNWIKEKGKIGQGNEKENLLNAMLNSVKEQCIIYISERAGTANIDSFHNARCVIKNYWKL